MPRLIKSKKAQAAVELAIMASIILLAFSALITLTEKVNRRQDHIQKVFRKQMIAAQASGSTSGTGDVYYRAPNIMDPYTPGELVTLESSGKVLWGGQSGGTANWSEGKQLENITYNKELIHEENAQTGGVMKARHRVTYKGGVTRGEYE